MSSENTDGRVKASSAKAGSKNAGAATESEIDHPTPEETAGGRRQDEQQQPSEDRDPDATINDANATGGASSFTPKVGDRVLVNGQIAELTAYERGSDIFTAIARAGNGTDRVTGHISNTRIEPLSAAGGTNETASDLDVPLKDTNWVSNPNQEEIDSGVLRVNAEVHNDLTASQTNSLGEHGSK